MRVVLDANVLVSALISRGGAPARLVGAWLAGDFELVVSETLLRELRQTLDRPKIQRYLTAAEAEEFVRLVGEVAEIVPDPEGPPPVQSADPADDYLIALAARERLPLVSGDGHLLALGDRLPVLSPRDFLARLAPS